MVTKKSLNGYLVPCPLCVEERWEKGVKPQHGYG